VRTYGFPGTLEEFCEAPDSRDLRVLEINEAGGLSPVLERLPNHRLACYPEHDITQLVYKDASFDLVVHSDTLEHVESPLSALAECRRVLRPRGACVFTVPLVVGRMSRSRAGMRKSFHGKADDRDDSMLVHWEFGSDVWLPVIEAGFSNVRIHCLEYPAAFAIEASHE
jgi:SAM-dependent methyltransferase